MKKAFLANLDYLVHLDLQGFRDQWGHQGFQENQVPQGHQDLQARRATWVWAFRVQKVKRENKESVVPQGHQDLHHMRKKKEAKS